MQIKLNRIPHFVVLSLCFMLSAGCSASDSYFLGMEQLDRGNTVKAQKYFENALKANNSVEEYLALQELCKIAPASKRLAYTKKCKKTTHCLEIDVDNLYVQSLVDNRQYAKAFDECEVMLERTDLSFSQRTWFQYCKAVSLLEMNRSAGKYNFEDEYVLYFMQESAVNDYHKEFYLRYQDEDFFQKPFLKFRVLVADKDYLGAKKIFEEEYGKSFSLESLKPSQISDFGKFILFSQKFDNAEWAKKFADVALQKGKCRESFYLHFYAGRLYDKAKNLKAASDEFLASADCSFSDSTYDNALWYYLSERKTVSEADFLVALEKYGPTIKNKGYYSDLFEQVFVNMLSGRRWTSFCNINPLVSKFASEKIKGYYNYIFARLLQEGFVNRSSFSSFDEEKLFRSVIENSESSTYYIMLSAKHLGMTPKAALETLFVNEEFSSPDEKTTKEVIEFLDYALKHKRIKELYSVYKDFRKYVSSDYVANLAYKVNELAKKNESFYPYVLRLASWAIFTEGGGKNLDLYELYYPQFYKNEVHEMAEKYGLDKYLMYGLIHSESFFDKNVESFAGAIGLCQLMPSTASDIAKKLKISEYDLKDAGTNIEFGCFYFAEMIRRLDGSVMSAIVSYNSGITRVRNWHKKYPNVPIDIFIEMLPIQESRGYGKKVLSAAAIYGFLYYDTTTDEVINSILR